MNRIIILITVILLLALQTPAQSSYEVEPGTKGNEIAIILSNSSSEIAENIDVELVKSSSDLDFKKEREIIKSINSKTEKEVSFQFDINREAAVNKKDTVEFNISYGNGTDLRKSFILTYTAPKEFSLKQNYPNPFNPSTKIEYQLPVNGKVVLKVFDILGREVTTLVNEIQQAGFKEVEFNAKNLSSGIYIYRIQSADFTKTLKMQLVK